MEEEDSARMAIYPSVTWLYPTIQGCRFGCKKKRGTEWAPISPSHPVPMFSKRE